MYKQIETKIFNLSKEVNKRFNYQFQFWTNLQRKYFLKQRKPIMDMLIHFRDNKDTEIDEKAFSHVYMNPANYTMLSSHTQENYGIEPPLYNHKLITLYAAQSSHQYEKDFANDPQAKFESKLQDNSLMCYNTYVPVFNKKLFVNEEEAAEERARIREEKKAPKK